MNVLTLNAGSSSIKYKVYIEAPVPSHQFLLEKKQELTVLVSGLIEGIGEQEGAWHHSKQEKEISPHYFSSHEQAFEALAAKLKADLKDYPIHGVGHRVVHGGTEYFQPTMITNEVLNEIKNLSKLAPIHNPINALGIEFSREYFPNAVQLAIFDTGFHHTMPQHVCHYAIETEVAKRHQIRRYGFHGINHEYVTDQAAKFLHKPLASCHFISLHLGNGASACLIKNGQSYDTSMGMTPLAGLVMGTRCGDIDPAIVLYLQDQGFSATEVDKLLNQRSGLMGIALENDMRKLIARATAKDEVAILAIDTYVYAIQKTIGAYCSQVHPLDALIFTGGVGENATLIREKVLSPLDHLGFILDKELNLNTTKNHCHRISKKGIPIIVISGDEEVLIAQKVIQQLRR